MGDEPKDDALDELLRHQEWARRLARRLVRDESGADDVVQQTLLAAIEHPPADPTTPKPWLARVVRSWVARGARSQGRRERREREARRDEATESAYDVVARADLQRFLANELFALGEPYRTTLLLRYFDGLALREIAARTDVPLETVRTRLRRGLARLRARLEERARVTGHDWRAGLLALAGADPRRAARGPGAASANGSSGTASLAAGAVVGALLAGVVIGAVVVTRTGTAPATAPAAQERAAADGASAASRRAAHARGQSAQGAEPTVAANAPAAAAAVPVRSPAATIALPAPWMDGSALVTSLAFTADGSVVSGTRDGSVKVWSVPRGDVVRTLRGHAGEVTCVAASPDGTRVVSGGTDRTVRVWDAASGAETAVLSFHGAELRQVACGPGGLVATSDVAGGVIVWRIADGAVVARIAAFTGGRYARALDFSADGRTLFAASTVYDGVRAWNVADGRPQPGAARAGRACRDDAATGGLWTATETGPLLLSPAGEPQRRLSAPAEVTALEVSREGAALAGTRDGTVLAWTRDSDAPLWTARPLVRDVMALALSADGARAAVACGTGRIFLLDAATGRPPAPAASEAPARADGHEWAVSAVAADPAGRFVASSSWDGTIKLWDISSRALLRTLRGHEDWVIAVDVSACGRFVASSSHDRTVRVWDAVTGAALHVLRGHGDIVAAVQFDPDGRHVLSGSKDGTAILWDLDTGRAAQTFRGHTAQVRGVAFLPRDRVATAAEDGAVRVWSRESGRALAIGGGRDGILESLAATPDGARLVTGGHDGTVRVWDPESGACLATMTGHTGWVHEVAVSADGRFVASAGHDASVRRWELASGSAVDLLLGHQVAADGVAFLPDGRLLTGGWDQRILLWDAPAARPGVDSPR